MQNNERTNLNIELQRFAKYTIKNDFLYELLTYGDGLDDKFGLSNWNNDHGSARPLLTLIAMRAFDIYRLPWKHDRCFCKAFNKDFDSAFRRIDEKVIRDAVADAIELYKHTQTCLRSLGCTTIRLNRSLYNEGQCVAGYATQIGYATFFSQLASAAAQLKRPTFSVPTDILSSWCYGPYGNWSVVIENDIAVEDIAWCSALIASRDRQNSSRKALEDGEWIVLNRSVDGCVTMPSTCVVERPDVSSPRQKKWHAEGEECELIALLDQKAFEFEQLASTRHQYMWPAPQQLSFTTRLKRSWALLHNRRVV
ncbi:MAG: hypothetical protein Q8K22_08530 [Rhodoferax sp.]|nr:hypothetical protein [Rhodoferax sp.]